MKLKVVTCVLLLGVCACIEDVPQFHLEGNFTSQVEQIYHHTRLTRAEINNLTRLYDELYQSLGSIWPDVNIVTFGSVTYGLAMKWSDVDCLVQLPTKQLTPVEISNQTYRQLLRQPESFDKIELIIVNSLPRVVFYHVPTRRYCDLTFSGPSAVKNTRLVRYMLSLDQRALNLALLVKYWAKVHRINGYKKMKSYALVVHVIFFLQQKSILPSVFELQKNFPISLGDDDGWNTRFVRKTHRSNNNETLYQLLGGFYKYYSEFQFDKYVIAPYLGRIVDRIQFENIDNLPPEYALYKQNIIIGMKPLPLDAPFCIQDPFDHNSNLVKTTSEFSKRVISLYKLAAKIFLIERSDNYLTSILTQGYLAPLDETNRI